MKLFGLFKEMSKVHKEIHRNAETIKDISKRIEQASKGVIAEIVSSPRLKEGSNNQ